MTGFRFAKRPLQFSRRGWRDIPKLQFSDGLVAHVHCHASDDGYAQSLGEFFVGADSELTVPTVTYEHLFELENLSYVMAETIFGPNNRWRTPVHLRPYGTSVFNNNASGSFLEAEIYQAALSHNNVHFFLMEPFNPPEKLKGLPNAETKQTYRQSSAKLQLSNTSRHA